MFGLFTLCEPPKSFVLFMVVMPILILFQMRLTSEIKAILTKQPKERTNQQLSKVLKTILSVTQCSVIWEKYRKLATVLTLIEG